jgi:hypothetical protein
MNPSSPPEAYDVPAGCTAILFGRDGCAKNTSKRESIMMTSGLRVNRSEMSFDSSNFFLKDFMPKPSLEFSLS